MARRVQDFFSGQLAAELAESASTGQVGLEQKLRELSNHSNALIRRHFQDVPRYIGNIIHEASWKYTGTPSSYVILCKKLLADLGADVVFVTLNYDTLLERALELFNPRFTFRSIDDFVDGQRQARVFKFHGSVDWWVQGISQSAIERRQASGGIQYILPDRPWDIIVKFGDFFRDLAMFPLLTLPLVGKTPDDILLPARHQEMLRGQLRDRERVLFVGTSGLDENLTTFLSQFLGDVRVVHVVAGSDASKVAERLLSQVPQLRGAKRAVLDIGFRKYVSDGEYLKMFAAT